MQKTANLSTHELLIAKPLFTVHRWKAIQNGNKIELIAFDGQLGYERDDYRGWTHTYTVSSLSEAVETIISVFTGVW